MMMQMVREEEERVMSILGQEKELEKKTLCGLTTGGVAPMKERTTNSRSTNLWASLMAMRCMGPCPFKVSGMRLSSMLRACHRPHRSRVAQYHQQRANNDSAIGLAIQELRNLQDARHNGDDSMSKYAKRMAAAESTHVQGRSAINCPPERVFLKYFC